MIDLSYQSMEVLLKIYIGQNIRKEGILQSEIKEKDQAKLLLKEGLILEDRWYLYQFRTTEKGSEIAKALVRRRIEEKRYQLESMLREIPEKVLGFFIKRYISENFVFRVNKPSYIDSWQDSMLSDSRLWILWDKFFTALESSGLCVKTYYYVATRGGERRDIHYVISPEIREFLISAFPREDFTIDQENVIKLYSVLKKLERILASDDLDFVRQQYYQILKDTAVSEEQLAGIIDAMNKLGITSEYRGLLSDKKPFEIFDPSRFDIHLDKNLIEPAVNILLQQKDEIQTFTTDKKIPNLEEVKITRGILNEEELGEFYIIVSSFERQLRDFIKTKLGKRWEERIQNDFQEIFQEWIKRREDDKRWGIEPEKELINYADLGHYIQIVEKYDRLFTSGEDLASVKVKLIDWYRYGRNPIMHSRTVTLEKFIMTQSAINFLREWMRRKSE